jgi:predicted transposase YbfD/YdcC
VTAVCLNLSSNAASWLTEAQKWHGIQSVVMVERLAHERVVKGVLMPATHDVRYFISSLDRNAQDMLKITVGHWSVEVIHNQLDVTFGEDSCRINRGNAAEEPSAMRKLGVNIIKLHAPEIQNDECFEAPEIVSA